MLNHHIEPIEFRCECGECEGCCKDWEFGEDNSCSEEEAIAIAQFNYECKVYNELHRTIPWGKRVNTN